MNTNSSGRIRCSFRQFFKALFYGFVTEYETPKIVMIHSYAITTLLRVMQVMLLLYSIFYLLLYEKGYQKQDTAIISSITLKVKGIGHIQTPDNQFYVFDGTDYIVPPSENNAIFIMTNFIPTDQRRSSCAESPSIKEAKCTRDSDCRDKPFMTFINGRWTGRCLFSSNLTNSNQTKTSTGLCELQGWCPVEDDEQARTIIRETRNFTIFIKNFIEFPTFRVKHKNMVENLRSCIYHPTENRDCPIFRLDHIISAAEKNRTEREVMLLSGAVIRVKIDWDCNLDRSIKLCRPKYSFARLDAPSYEETFSPGFNFRFASHWKYRKMYLRSMKKAFGLRLIISVSGKAGRFDFITLTLNTGSLVGIFGLATFFCDWILLNLSKKSYIYRDYIFEHANGSRIGENSAVYHTKTGQDQSAMIYKNTHTRELGKSHPLSTTESLGAFSNTTQSSQLIDANELLKLQRNIGLSNAMN